MRNLTHLHRQLRLFTAATAVASCGSFAPDDERYDRLDKLRVLAIQSEPADVAFGETATLRANIYEPNDRDLKYEWSWCPSRADGNGGFECNISEDALVEAWASLGLSDPPPSYDLGSNPEALFTHLLTPELVGGLCQAITQGSNLNEEAILGCFMGLQASVKLTVRTSKDEVTAIRTLTLLMDETHASERNTNPTSNFSVRLRDKDTKTVVKDGQALQAGHRYTVTADLDDAIAEAFTPAASPEEPKPKKRRETLIMSWFLTEGGVVSAEDNDGLNAGDVRSTFVDGRNDFEAVTKNGWELPLTAGPQAELLLVLRDERGGVGWTRQSFKVSGGKR